MARGKPFGIHRCPVKGCVAMIPRLHVACSQCWPLAPKWLQQQITEQLRYGIANRCHPTDDFLKARSQVIEAVNRALSERYRKPAGQQLPLLSTT
jgi:hypothetical protein